MNLTLFPEPEPPAPPADGLPRVVHVADRVPGAVYVGRDMSNRGYPGHPLGNPFRRGTFGGKADVIDLYRRWLWSRIASGDAEVIAELIALRRAPAIACWCRRDGAPITDETACHADVIRNALARFTDGELLAYLGE